MGLLLGFEAVGDLRGEVVGNLGEDAVEERAGLLIEESTGGLLGEFAAGLASLVACYGGGNGLLGRKFTGGECGGDLAEVDRGEIHLVDLIGEPVECGLDFNEAGGLFFR